MVNNGHFKQDLALGQLYEKKAQDALILHLDCDVSVTEERNDNLYDFKLSNGFSYEVKFDRMCSHTGNIYIETASHRRLAGLSVSKADFYIFAIGDRDTKFYMIGTAILKKMIDDDEYTRIHDDCSKTGYIFKLQTIASKSIQL